MKTCDILINANIDRFFTYKVPDEIKDKLYTGHVVTVPFGNRTTTGIVTKLSETSEYENLKDIIAIKYDIRVLNQNSLKLIQKTSEYFLQNMGKFCSKLIPHSGPYVRTEYEILSAEGASKRQKEILSVINGRISREHLLRHTTYHTLNKMIRQNLLREYSSIEPCNNTVTKKIDIEPYTRIEPPTGFNDFKTTFIEQSSDIYGDIIGIINHNLKHGKKTLIILPQLISHVYLTNLIKLKYENNVCFYSSAMGNREKNRSFYNIVLGIPKIIIGTGDVLFLPYKNIGSIIFLMPESPHHFHYVNMPYYHAEIVAGFFSKIYSAPLYVIGRTPSINMVPSIRKKRTKVRENAIKNTKTIFLKSNNPYDILTKQIISEIKHMLFNKKKGLLIYNHLGYYPFVKCNKCNEIVTCPACGNPLVFTGRNNLYYCRKCKKHYTIRKCINCGSTNLSFSGTGIEKIASIIRKEFKNIKIKIHSAGDGDFDLQTEQYDLLLTTSVIFKDIFPVKFDIIIIPSIETILNEKVIKSEFNFIRIIEYLKLCLKEQGKIVLQSPLYYDFIPYLTSGKIGQYTEYTLNLRKRLNLPPYYHVISLKPVRGNISMETLYAEFKSKDRDSITKSMDGIIIKTKTLSKFSHLKSLQRKNTFRIFVDSEEYL